ncbi:phosphoribosyl-ATP diphosphatase [Clostridium sp. CX1]|uniref:Phosphoribosyl-ATP pyrophosphatase n=1 Tax=Clostridium tanneri TaxID=3037988 RepID=A0ABU4JSS6_9CLOT|nr:MULTISPECIES: phosphoribosyl-ATP diphosphatase [unclassified Clostridium]MCT8976954.1 phosphoribosyl-ATP diphosphatase [Clostridium sp. CX1]MDW8801162.1 phosphoribosyl-ATP diphosphatase [Clostridium sp. A1-XYC3]
MELKSIVEQLYGIIEERRENPIEGSYTSYLFKEGLDKILKKIGEESSEIIIGAKNNSKDEVVYETCDLVYHLLVLMVQQGIDINDLVKELEKRRLKICNKKPERKTVEGIH